MNRTILLAVLLFINVVTIFSQKQGQELIDSLSKELPNAKEDTNKIKILYELSYEYRNINPEKGLEYGLVGQELSQKLNWNRGVVSCLRTIGINYSIQNEYEKGLDYLNKALKLSKKIKYKSESAKILGSIGIVHYMTSNYQEAIKYHKMALKLDEEIDNWKGIAKHLGNISKAYLKLSEYDQAINILNNALKIFKNYDKREYVNILSQIAKAYYQAENYEESIKYYNKTIERAKGINYNSVLALSYSNLGVIYYKQGKYSKTIDYYLKALKIDEGIGNKRWISSDLNQLGTVYTALDDNEKALKYYEKSLKIAKELNLKKQMAAKYHNIANIIIKDTNNVEKAKDYYEKAYEINVEFDNKYYQGLNLIALGYIYKSQFKFEKALDHLNRALEVFEKIDSEIGKCYVLHELGNLYCVFAINSDKKEYFEFSTNLNHNKLYNLNKSIEMHKKAILLAKNINLTGRILLVYEDISYTYKEMGNYKNAYEYHVKYTELKDSIFSIDKAKEIANLEAKRENEIKDAEIKILNKEKEYEAEKNKWIIISFSGGVISLLVLAFGLYLRYRFKSKAETLLKQKNEEISNAHENITASITYASKIQAAMLPFNDKMEELLNEYFVLFLPKDIVSGDFYWIEKIDGKIFLVVSDCTGHGVPGAFMSMIGNEMLNNIIIKQKVDEPAQILAQMHKDVRFALKQDETVDSTHDGMDVCICVIDKNENKLTFAGAKRPLYYVQNNEFYEIKGDKKPIGGRQKEEDRTFTNNEIELQSGMMIYLTTDGYQDQHNIDQEKYGVKRFRGLLHSIADKPMEKQKNLLEKELNEFSQGEKNRDDVAVLGVRI